MSSKAAVPLSTRQADYRTALARAERAAEAYLDARAAGRMTNSALDEMDAAQAELRRAKRRLEETERRLAKAGLSDGDPDPEREARRHSGLGGLRLPG
jgi:hypothetical protein